MFRSGNATPPRFMYKSQRTLQIVPCTEREMRLLEFWEFLKISVRDLYANRGILEFGKFQPFSVSVT